MIDLRFQPMTTRVRRSGPPQRANFSAAWPRVLDDLERELTHLRATDIIVEGGFESHQVRNDGWPKGGASPRHHDIRLHFKSQHGPLSFECGCFDHYEANLRAIGLVMQDLRLMKARGVGSGQEQYRGWQQLPPGGHGPDRPPCPAPPPPEWPTAADALEFLAAQAGFRSAGDAPADLAALYRAAAMRAHPDKGGSSERMARVTRARDFIRRSGGGAP